jgi:hypothetical protein
MGARTVAALAAGLLASAAAAMPCLGCSCADLGWREVHDGAAAIFRGTVLAEQQPSWWDRLLWNLGAADDLPDPRAILRVEAVWKGDPGRAVAVENAGCGLAFAPGRSYVVYAFRTEDGGLWTSGCSPTVGDDLPAVFLGTQVGLGPGTPVALE